MDPANPLSKISPKLVGLIRLASALGAEDINFYKSIDKDVKAQSDDVNSRMRTLLNRLIRSSATASMDLDPDSLVIEEGQEEQNTKIIGSIIDSLAESLEINLDKYKQMKRNHGKTPKIANDDGFTYLDENDRMSGPSRLPEKMHYSKVAKPQLLFKEKVDNFEKHPFRPYISDKPHATVPFNKSMELVAAEEDVPEHYINPYEFEIMNAKYPEWMFSPIDPPYESVPWKGSPQPTWVDKPEQLDELIAEMSKCRVIGVDLEHHDYRTYHGLTSLMQITTETKKDYLIDPLSPELRPHLSELNVVFANPDIVKVFHGAFMDMIWLQRDLGLYVVSLFDTYWAAKELALGKYSLAFLLEKYVRFRTSKKWQLADWRMRPLNDEMRNYAKADTHFLIELFGKIQADLLKKPGSMPRVLNHSRKVSNRRFEYATYKPRNATAHGVVSTNGSVPLRPEYQDSLFSFDTNRELPWENLMRANGLPLQSSPIVEALFKWRDTKARAEDESPRYIMSDFGLTSLVTAFTPDQVDQVTESKVLDIVSETARFGSSYYVRKCVKELTQLLRKVLREVSKVDISTWSAVSGTPELISNINDKLGDVYKSVKNTERLEDEFDDLSSFYKKINFVEEPPKSVKMEEDGSSLDAGAVWSVKYNKGNVAQIKSVNVLDRLDVALEHLSQVAAPVVRIEEEEEEAEPLPVEAAVPEAAKKSVEVPKENPEEVITLRQHQRGRKRKHKETAEKQDEEKLDFSKKVMDPVEAPKKGRRGGRGKKGKKKGTSYDPYGASGVQSAAIAEPKTRKKRNIGKNTVFRK